MTEIMFPTDFFPVKEEIPCLSLRQNSNQPDMNDASKARRLEKYMLMKINISTDVHHR